ncbi:MAG: exosortase system-associated protein, TIGR04073 family [Verrucomicrobiaceae bacterium]|nr:exosortase system-associated protein, TIGR04073 family [Verrucomicrobiaceae bacterium]
MKKIIAITLAVVFAAGTFALADIQSPPGHQFSWSRKLSRALANLAYGGTEILTVWQKSNRTNGNIAASTDAVVEGSKRTAYRAGYGLYELITFPVPSWKCTYRPPYHVKGHIDNWHGYDEFPPQVGIISEATYSRTQHW